MATRATPWWRIAVALALVAGLSSPSWAGGGGLQLPDCPVAAFGEASASQHAAMLSDGCNYDSSRLKLETPRAKPVDPGPSLVKAEYSALSSMRFSSLVGTFKFDWSGLRQSDANGGLRTARTALSVGGLVRLVESLSLQTSFGLEHTAGPRTRTIISSVWQPTKAGVLFAEWAGSEAGTEARRVGGRWWLVPRTLAIDLGARYVPDGPGWSDQRVGVSLNFGL
jgi:hypothetical protein